LTSRSTSSRTPLSFHDNNNNNNNSNMASGIGFIGLGIMGEGMAARLLSQGVAGTPDTPLVVWNRTPTKCQALQALFPDKTIVVETSAAAVVAACGVTYSMLSTPEASAAVFDAPDVGTLAGVTAGKSIIDCATLAEADMQRMKEAVEAKGG
jgi:3-hydroxyisobutyrate dehydrogenase-like beta-hydroxyacid dehydrogenase